MNPLAFPTVRAAMNAAWVDSQPNSRVNRHEEGGYVVHADGGLEVHRWQRGEQSQLTPPPLDADHCYNGKVAIAAFHTHPNPPIDEIGEEWEQTPSKSDRRWHQRRKLRGFVISRSLVYEIDVLGNVYVVGAREKVLAL